MKKQLNKIVEAVGGFIAVIGALVAVSFPTVGIIALVFLAKVGFFYLLWLLIAYVFNLWFLESYLHPAKVYQIVAILCFLHSLLAFRKSE